LALFFGGHTVVCRFTELFVFFCRQAVKLKNRSVVSGFNAMSVQTVLRSVNLAAAEKSVDVEVGSKLSFSYKAVSSCSGETQNG